MILLLKILSLLIGYAYALIFVQQQNLIRVGPAMALGPNQLKKMALRKIRAHEKYVA